MQIPKLRVRKIPLFNLFGDNRSLHFSVRSASVGAPFYFCGVDMKIAVIGSRNLCIENLEDYLPEGCTEIVSGGAKGVDSSAAQFAKAHSIKLTEFLPQYEKYGRAAPIVRNKQIVDHADMVLAFWNGKSAGTRSVIGYCEKTRKQCKIILIDP